MKENNKNRKLKEIRMRNNIFKQDHLMNVKVTDEFRLSMGTGIRFINYLKSIPYRCPFKRIHKHFDFVQILRKEHQSQQDFVGCLSTYTLYYKAIRKP